MRRLQAQRAVSGNACACTFLPVGQTQGQAFERIPLCKTFGKGWETMPFKGQQVAYQCRYHGGQPLAGVLLAVYARQGLQAYGRHGGQ